MITVTFARMEGGQEVGSRYTRQLTQAKAYGLLVSAELAFYARVTEIKPTSLSLETSILSLLDLTTFEGEVAEMLPLVTIAKLYEASDPAQVTAAFNAAWPAEVTAEHAQAMSGLFMGRSRLLVACLMGFNVIDEADVRACLKAGLQDTLAALELRQENPGVSLAQILG